MTQDEILKIANDMAFMASIWVEDDSDEFKDMIKFAQLVAAKEREACAKIADAEAFNWQQNSDGQISVQSIAAAIRARGEA